MKRLSIPIIVFVSLNMIGCSMPITAIQGPLYSFTMRMGTSKSGFTQKKFIQIKDFRGNDAYDEDMAALKAEVEKYISQHPDLSESVKNDLRALKVTQGAAANQVTLLLGKPDKIIKVGGAGHYGASEAWIYRISKMHAFTVFIIPMFFVHEGYYLYFKDGALVEIERHTLKQVIQQSEPLGPAEHKK